MFGKRNTDVLIAGAGPVGLFTALCAEHCGLQVMLVDKAWRTAKHSYGLALHPQTLQEMDVLEVAEPVLANAEKVRKVGIYRDDTRVAEVDYGTLNASFPFLAVLPQNDLEQLLESALHERKVEVMWNHRFDTLETQDNTCISTMQRLEKISRGYAVAHTEWAIDKIFQINSDFVIGADGHHSIVRRDLGAEYPLVGDTQIFAVFEFDCDAEPTDEVRIFIHEGTDNVLWPLPGGRKRFSFELPDAQVGDDSREKSRLSVEIGEAIYPFLTRDNLLQLIEERAPWFQGEIGEIQWSNEVRFERRLVNRFGCDRVWLVGDAAHMSSPVGSHSMNMGMQEGAELTRRLAKVVNAEEPISRMQDFGVAQEKLWRILLGLEGGPVADLDTDLWLEGNCKHLLPCVPASGPDLRGAFSQLGFRLDLSLELLESGS